MVLAKRNSTLFTILLVSLITTGLNLSAAPTLLTSAFAADDKDCDKNKGDNNCNDTKKNASPELECKHKIKDNEGSVIDSECTNNSQILIDSNIDSNGGDGNGDGDTGTDNPSITLNPTSAPVGTSVHVTGIHFHINSQVSITFNDIEIATTPFIVTTNPTGGFSASFTVPGDATEGPNIVAAIDDDDGQASAGFNVEAP